MQLARLQLISNQLWLLPVLYIVLLPAGSLYNIPLLVLSIIGIFILFRQFRALSKSPEFRLYLLLFLCIYIPIIIASIDAINLDASLRKAGSLPVYFFIGLAIIFSRTIFTDKKKHFIYATGCILTVWSIDGVWQYINGENFLGYPLTFNKRLTGIFYPQYRIGIIFALLSPFYFEFVRILQERYKYAFILLIPFMLVIILAGNRSSWVMLILSVSLYLVYLLKRYKKPIINWKLLIQGMVLISGLVLIVYVVSPGKYSEISRFIGSRVTSSHALELRMEIWEVSLRVLPDNWINGIGVRSFRDINPDEIQNKKPVLTDKLYVSSTHPHQITLEILVETGLVGLTGFIIFLVLLIQVYLKLLTNKQDENRAFWVIPVLLAVFPLNMHKAFYGHFSFTLIWFFLSIAIAASIKPGKIAQR